MMIAHKMEDFIKSAQIFGSLRERQCLSGQLLANFPVSREFGAEMSNAILKEAPAARPTLRYCHPKKA